MPINKLRVLKKGFIMSLNINNNGGVSNSGGVPETGSSEKFEFKQVQVGSIFLKDDGDGKISLKDFNKMPGQLENFLSEYVNSAADWTKDTYDAVVGYLNKHKDQIKEDSIEEAIASFQAKVKDKSQVAEVKTDGDWEVTEFKDGTFMKENKAENKVRYYDAQGRWIAGVTNQGVKYLNTYVDGNENLSYEYVSEELGNNNIYYYSKDNKLLMADNDKERVMYIDGPDGKLQQVEQRDIKTGKLQLIGYADENEKIVKIREFKKDPVTNKSYIEETDVNKNTSMNIYDTVVKVETMEVRDPNTNEVTYKKVIDHENHTITETENGVTKITDTITGEVTVANA